MNRVTMKERKAYSKEEKLRILQEAAAQEVKATLDKYGIYPATYYGWKRKVEAMGEKGLERGMTPEHLKEIRRLEKKTQRLMGEQDLLAPRRKAAKRSFVKYRVVTPERPLHVLEMDIKSKWVTGERRSGYVLTILDTFTRQALHWQAGLCMTQHQVTQAWDQVIKHHLQPADLLNKKLHVEVRSDNGPQFIASMVQGYFKDNHLHQAFTHPYTPQENGHIESFHAILGAYLDRHTIWDLDHLVAVLSPFYAGYNGKRVHGSIAYLWPDLFEKAWHNGLIQRIVDRRDRVKFKLLVPYQELLSGCRSLMEVSCLIPTGSSDHKQVSGPTTAGSPGSLLTPSVTQSPSVVSC